MNFLCNSSNAQTQSIMVQAVFDKNVLITHIEQIERYDVLLPLLLG